MAMKKALKQAQISPAAVDYVNAHATSTIVGDSAENAAIKSLLLGADGKKNASDVNISSTKGAVGHLLGGAGAVEAVFSVLAIQDVSLCIRCLVDCTDCSRMSCHRQSIWTDWQMGSIAITLRIRPSIGRLMLP